MRAARTVWSVLLLGACLAVLARHAALPQALEFVDLGNLPGCTMSRAYDVNAQGQVVGVSGSATCPNGYEVAGHAFLWQDGTLTDLGTLPGHQVSVAYGINDSGWVVGSSGTAVVNGYRRDLLGHAYVIKPADLDLDGRPDCWFRDADNDGGNDLMVDLGTLLRPGSSTDRDDYSMGWAINNHGQVAAWSWEANSTFYRACIWSEASGLVDLRVGPTPGVTTSIAGGINEAGQVVGSFLYQGYFRGFVWTPASQNGIVGSWTPLGTLGGKASHAYAVNSSGLVVGCAMDMSDRNIGCTWDGAQPPTALSTLSSGAWDVNDGGVIVGTYLWAPGQAGIPMVQVVPGTYLNWTLVAAQAINNDGLIVGYATLMADNQTHAFLIRPANRPPVAAAGPDQTVECTGALTPVTLDGSGSADADGDALSYTWTGPFGTATGVQPTVQLGLGQHAITLTVDDGRGGTATGTVSITVQDTTPPVLHLPDNFTVNQDCAGGATVSFTASATDNSGSVDVACTPPSGSVFPLGTTTVACTATDASGNTETSSFTVTVVVPASTASNKVTGGGRISIAGGEGSFAMVEITNALGEARGNLTFIDHVRNVTYKSLQITSLVVSGTHGRIFGTASVDGAGSVDFVADVDDLATPGTNADVFAIQFSDGFTATGTILDNGNISVH